MEAPAKQTDTNCRDRETDEELAEVLTAISVVSKRLARKLSILSRQDREKTEGGNPMKRMSELSQAAAELKRCGEAMISIAESPWLTGAAVTVRLIRRAAANGSGGVGGQGPLPRKRYGPSWQRRAAPVIPPSVRELLEKHGAKKLSEIDPAEYPALLAEAEVREWITRRLMVL